MRKIIFLILVTLISTSLYAVPGRMELATPTKIERVPGKSLLKLTFNLPCAKEKWPFAWGSAVIVSDDAGDFAAAVGYIYSHDFDACGKSIDTLNQFTLEMDPKKYGYAIDEVEGGFYPMDLKK